MDAASEWLERIESALTVPGAISAFCRCEAVDSGLDEGIDDDGDLFMRSKKRLGMTDAYVVARDRKWGYLGVSREMKNVLILAHFQRPQGIRDPGYQDPWPAKLDSR